MFRELRRKNRQLPQEACVELLMTEKRGVLSLIGDGGYPYGIPMNHWYDPADGHLYFHGGKTGHRVDAADRDDRVSYCVHDQGTAEEGTWALTVRSVVVFGRLRRVEDRDRVIHISRQLSYRFTKDEAYIDREIERSAAGTLCWELIPEHMTGKRVVES